MKKKVFLFFIIAAFLACKKPYDPPYVAGPTGYLVVEGIISNGADSAVIKLSRTVSLDKKTALAPELNATVSVQSDQGVSYPFIETANGNYTNTELNLDDTHKYRLSIKTAKNEQILSDYVPVVNAPPIDSVYYDIKGTVQGPGLNIKVNTHDPSGKVRYFRWDYQETWEIQSSFDSKYKSNGDTVLKRDLINDDIFTCWQGSTSSSIVIGSSARLSQPIISNAPIISIASFEEKLGVEYSILVNQYALTADGYKFYENLKKNTQDLGTLFAAEPSEITGNIHSVTNPAKPVVGYFCVGKASSQRIFIRKGELPQNWVSYLYYHDCMLFVDTKDNSPRCCYYSYDLGGDGTINQVDQFINYNKPDYYAYAGTLGLLPVDTIRATPQSTIILGYTAAVHECVDCTLRGTNKMPAFWK